MAKTDSVYAHYDVLYEIAKGGFSRVYRASPVDDSGSFVAIKVIRTSLKSSSELFLATENEIQIMKDLKSLEGKKDNIVQIIETFQERRRLLVVMEYLDGGELFDRIVEKHHYSEYDAAKVLKMVVSTLQDIHNLGILHRDIKPENLVYQYKHSDDCLKLMDFGLSKYVSKPEIMQTAKYVGTSGYIAPEVMKSGDYSSKSDLFSMGVILFVMLSGTMPFDADDSVMRHQVAHGQILKELDRDIWKTVSFRAKTVIRGMLEANQEKRWTHSQILKSNWLIETSVKHNLDNMTQAIINLKKLRNKEDRERITAKLQESVSKNYEQLHAKLAEIVERNQDIRDKKLLAAKLPAIKSSLLEQMSDPESSIDKELFLFAMNANGFGHIDCAAVFDELLQSKEEEPPEQKRRDSFIRRSLIRMSIVHSEEEVPPPAPAIFLDDVLEALGSIANVTDEEFLPVLFDLFTTRDNDGKKRISFQGFKSIAQISGLRNRDHSVVHTLANIYTSSSQFQALHTTEAQVSIDEIESNHPRVIGRVTRKLKSLLDIFDQTQGETKTEKAVNLLRQSFSSFGFGDPDTKLND